MSIKRLHYYNHQFLDEKDFQDEQHYHVEMRRRLNRSLHSWGVAEGLQVVRSGNREITVETGFALDNTGRELMVLNPVTREIPHADRHTKIHVVITHKERFEDADRRTASGVEGYNRTTESVEVSMTHDYDKTAGGILLANLHMDADGNIANIDYAGRPSAGSLLAPNSVHTRHLVEGCVTAEKLADDVKSAMRQPQFELPDGSVTIEKLDPKLRSAMSARGWVRMPFKPLPIRPRGHRPKP